MSVEVIVLSICLLITNILWMIYTVSLLNSMPKVTGQTRIQMPHLNIPSLRKGADADHIATKREILENVTDTNASIDDVLAATRKDAEDGNR